jgi:hypothetical protein
MNINIFILCHNERALLPHTINHYKKYLPSCNITIYDNESTDDSVEIAKKLNCDVITWTSNNIIDDYKYIEIKNNCWKSVKDGWIIMIDMDEFLCVTENDLTEEFNKGTTILTVKGYEMLGESKTTDLTDIDLQEIKKYRENNYESKSLCFLRNNISEMNYSIGAHLCKPQGTIQYSSKTYINKHMSYLGLEFIIDKFNKRFERSEKMRSMGRAYHYNKDTKTVTNDYNNFLLHHLVL